MLHLTLNTGAAVQVGRFDDPAALTGLFDRLVATGGGAIPPWPPWRIEIHAGNGCALFSILKASDQMAVLSAVAWTPEGAEAAWDEIERPYLDTADVLARLGNLHPGQDAMPEMPATLPWLTSWVLPAASSFATLEDARWLADCEQLAAFAILRRYAGWSFEA